MMKIYCNGTIKVKGKSDLPCPHNKWACAHYSFRRKNSEPTTECEYKEYYDFE